MQDQVSGAKIIPLRPKRSLTSPYSHWFQVDALTAERDRFKAQPAATLNMDVIRKWRERQCYLINARIKELLRGNPHD